MKTSNLTATFKVGAVALVFLVLGYEIALFATQAARLEAVSKLDRPDTVYVYLSADSLTSVGTSRRNYPHPSRVVDAGRRLGRAESFPFDPNTAGEDEFVRLGLSRKQAASIVKYRQNGGRFRRREDFARSYAVPDSVYRRLEPFINIPKIDINKADSAEFDALPGIGGYFAAKMVEYRERLGGYSYPEQLMDIYRFDEEKFRALEDLIECSRPQKPFRIWTLPPDSLRLHPYIRNYNAARAIVLLRENTPADSLRVELIGKAGILPEEDYRKLSSCFLENPK